MTYLDLFSGIGGFALGFKQAGWKFDKHYYSEIDKYAQRIYQNHFPEAVAVGDVSKVDGNKLGQIDLITFGFPCQDLSIAGKRAGLGGSRSGLFYEATRIIRECKPSIFIFENVKGLLTSNEGKDFESVLREIADIGLYECEWQLLNTSWVLPQNRERIYFIGHLGERGGRKVFPIGENDTGNNEVELSRTQTNDGGGSEDAQDWRGCAMLTPGRLHKRQNGRRMKEEGEPSFTLTGQDIHGVMIKEATKQGYAIAKEGDSINLSQPNSKTRRGRVGGGDG